RPIGPRRALALGLCDATQEAPAPPAASASARALVLQLACASGRGGALTPRQARVLERACFALAFAGGDPAEGIAAFFERRPARFAGDTGRRAAPTGAGDR
ncbi:MAG TPA: hypothetical protein VJV23_11655, partial [Candidatus Polarisedimenticolia bacterium]|nr:hypothetical protein [Candidatus Polarisedimenticolia bacterium]